MVFYFDQLFLILRRMLSVSETWNGFDDRNVCYWNCSSVLFDS